VECFVAVAPDTLKKEMLAPVHQQQKDVKNAGITYAV